MFRRSEYDVVVVGRGLMYPWVGRHIAVFAYMGSDPTIS